MKKTVGFQPACVSPWLFCSKDGDGITWSSSKNFGWSVHASLFLSHSLFLSSFSSVLSPSITLSLVLSPSPSITLSLLLSPLNLSHFLTLSLSLKAHTDRRKTMPTPKEAPRMPGGSVGKTIAKEGTTFWGQRLAPECAKKLKVNDPVRSNEPH